VNIEWETTDQIVFDFYGVCFIKALNEKRFEGVVVNDHRRSQEILWMKKQGGLESKISFLLTLVTEWVNTIVGTVKCSF